MFLRDLLKDISFAEEIFDLYEDQNNEKLLNDYKYHSELPNIYHPVTFVFDLYLVLEMDCTFKEFIKLVFENMVPEKPVFDNIIEFRNNVPICAPPYGDDIYKVYRKYEEKSGDFVKYYKIKGAMLAQEKWKNRFKEFKPINDNNFGEHVHNMPVYKKLFKVFEENFPHEKYWPFMTCIVSDPLVREDISYPLITPNDILRFYYYSSLFIDEEELKKEMIKFTKFFFGYVKEDIYAWKDKMMKENPTYKKLLNEADKKKIKYVWNKK